MKGFPIRMEMLVNPDCAYCLVWSVLLWIANFPLVADGEDADYVVYRDISIEGDVARAAERNHQLTNLSLDATADERVIAQRLDPVTNGFYGSGRNIGVVLRQEFERPLDIAECVLGID
jgi:hypothetical protein